MRIRNRLAFVLLSLHSMCAVNLRADKISFSGKRQIVSSPAQTVQARKAIQAIYDRQAAALVRKDIKGFLAPMTSDYRDLKYGNRLYTIAHLRQQLPGLVRRYPPGFQFNITIQKFQLLSQRAKTTANYHVQVVRTDAEHHTKELWASDTVSEDEWIKTGMQWRLKSSRETRFKNKKTPLSKPAIERKFRKVAHKK